MISRIPLRSVLLLCCLLAVISLAMPASVGAQIGLVPAANTANAQLGAPFDLSGYWVAIVTEDWRYRMLTPDKGDFPGMLRSTPEGQRIANAGIRLRTKPRQSCKSYGAGAIMRVPTRLHITWENDNTLQGRDRRREANPRVSFRQRAARGSGRLRCRDIPWRPGKVCVREDLYCRWRRIAGAHGQIRKVT